jgi:hypothetical protein
MVWNSKNLLGEEILSGVGRKSWSMKEEKEGMVRQEKTI